jgi:hypothetical protein
MRDGSLGAELNFSFVHEEAQRASPPASFSPSPPPLREEGKFLSKTKCVALPNTSWRRGCIFFFFISEVLVLSNHLWVKLTPCRSCVTEPPRFDSINTFWSSLGTLVSLMVGVVVLSSEFVSDSDVFCLVSFLLPNHLRKRLQRAVACPLYPHG